MWKMILFVQQITYTEYFIKGKQNFKCVTNLNRELLWSAWSKIKSKWARQLETWSMRTLKVRAFGSMALIACKCDKGNNKNTQAKFRVN